MGRNAGDDGFAHHEARWLDKSSYFNHNPQPIGVIPTLTRIHPIMRVHDDIKLNIDIQSPNGVHQVEIARTSDRAVVAWDYMNGQPKVTARFDFDRWALEADKNRIWIRIIDTQGALSQTLRDIIIPSRPRQKNPIETPPDPEPKPEVEPTPKPEPPKFVPTRGHLTTSWAKMKRRR